LKKTAGTVQGTSGKNGCRKIVYCLFICRSADRRIAGSSRVERFLSKEAPSYQPFEEVDLLMWRTSEIGYMAIINNRHEGMLYAGEVLKS
jgi:predicted RNA-binding protein (virulence factor B family)